MAASPRTHYDVLGISRDADASAVRSAWKLHVQAWHPDRFGEEMRAEAERQTQLINDAYTTLRDASRRAAYDCRLAADEAATRPEPAPRMSHKVRPAAPRAAAAPVGSPMPMPEPATLGEQAAAIGRDAWSIVRRHPRIAAVAATIWVFVFGGSVVLHAVSGPDLTVAAASARPAAAMVADPAQTEDLEDLAERAREEAAEADAEMAQLMREDAALAAAEAKAIERERALALQAARTAAKSGKARKGSAAAPTAPRAGRVVRVMPNTA